MKHSRSDPRCKIKNWLWNVLVRFICLGLTVLTPPPPPPVLHCCTYMCQLTRSVLVQFMTWNGIRILSFSIKKMKFKLPSAKMADILSRGRWVKYWEIMNINESNDRFMLCSYVLLSHAECYSFPEKCSTSGITVLCTISYNLIEAEWHI